MTHWIRPVPPLDEEAMREARRRQGRLTKPPGSLGRLEGLAVHLAGMTGRVRHLKLRHKAVIVMAADHGITAEGVSAYPAEVTAQMVQSFARGTAAINVLARTMGARVVTVDIGVRGPEVPGAGWVVRKVGPGTRNFLAEPAMSRVEAICAIETGIDIVEQERSRGLDLLATGDMGIGNTTASSAITAVLCGRTPAEVTGPGTGLSHEQIVRKADVIERAITLHRPDPSDPLDVLVKVGGFEIGGIVGVILGAAASRVPILIDGFVSGAAALIAARLAPVTRDYLIAGHRSTEPGHQAILDHLNLEPILDLGLRLGEGTGAVLAMPILEAAGRLLDEMATFEEARVSHRSPDHAQDGSQER
ncbi:nicotinate-nucleotide--dimethylbenzimidazole phosphoribosyltransferase [Candidatus Methylomirabilis lanthanidiphila]|uniref:Nicotinate-nucleotide--dimethylbenzimidazole phosphoribosyltransferase n=1 Tax=Candidatus Methylomirabilis lanthanidiphila TaxID=2211376 RepID=A0A564ZG76_9BACT|nr:nicotinate-nucleotide--dimethylbenzimidazole phosphoribosyltransferase [Candidatus Methylomirabilis lanthanidiphila]VUZ84294.1 nicotinate-nucleotide--dimethylbenzimidazole phosphoribosyltransferase [Candidatus Methylomirabilis lanthanidiphila]